MIDVTWRELRLEVEKMADAMISVGVRTGDRVAAIISNRSKTMICCLAALSIGIIWSTSSLDMGPQGILNRLMQIRPKLVFAESSVLYNGKIRQLLPKHKEWTKKLSSTPEFVYAIMILESDVSKLIGETILSHGKTS